MSHTYCQQLDKMARSGKCARDREVARHTARTLGGGGVAGGGGGGLDGYRGGLLMDLLDLLDLQSRHLVENRESPGPENLEPAPTCWTGSTAAGAGSSTTTGAGCSLYSAVGAGWAGATGACSAESSCKEPGIRARAGPGNGRAGAGNSHLVLGLGNGGLLGLGDGLHVLLGCRLLGVSGLQ